MRSGDLGIEMLDGDLGGCKWKKRKGWGDFWVFGLDGCKLEGLLVLIPVQVRE